MRDKSKLIQIHARYISPHHTKEGLVVSDNDTRQYAKYEQVVCKFCGFWDRFKERLKRNLVQWMPFFGR